MTTIYFTLNGDPVPKGRPRFGKGRTYTPAKTRAYEKAVATMARNAHKSKPPEGPLKLMATFVFPIPKSWPKKKRAAAARGELFHASKPDLDNLAKLIKDAMNGIVYKDDSQIWAMLIHKEYGARPMVKITVTDELKMPPLT
jgi:Holliday junction resolvase RusA-like endonuclease